MTFRKILFPVDYSEPCKAIVPYIQDMVHHYSAELTVVHAYGPEALGFIDLPMLDPSFLEKARRLLLGSVTSKVLHDVIRPYGRELGPAWQATSQGCPTKPSFAL